MIRAACMAAVAVLMMAMPVTAGGFEDRAISAQSTFSTGSLQPPEGLATTVTCQTALTATADLSWTPSPSTTATGHLVERYLDGVLKEATLVGATTGSLQETDLVLATTYTWTVKAVVGAWTSTESSVSASTPLLCL